MKSRRSTRGLSPIFATLILIAIAVIAGIIVYMFASGTLAAMLGGGTAGQEKVAIQAVASNSTILDVVVWAKSTGGGPVTIDGAILKDAAGIVVEVMDSTGIANGLLPADGTLTDVTVTFANYLVAGDTYTITLTSEAGGSFVSSSFKCP